MMTLSETITSFKRHFAQASGALFGWATGKQLRIAMGLDTLAGQNFSGRTDLKGVDWRTEELSNILFRNVDLSGGDMRKRSISCDFQGATTRGLKLQGACLYHAKNMTEAQMMAAQRDEYTKWPKDLTVRHEERTRQELLERLKLTPTHS